MRLKFIATIRSLVMNERIIPDKKASHFSTRLVERIGAHLVEKNVAIGSRSRQFIKVDKSNIEIEQAFRLASEKVSRA